MMPAGKGGVPQKPVATVMQVRSDEVIALHYITNTLQTSLHAQQSERPLFSTQRRKWVSNT